MKIDCLKVIRKFFNPFIRFYNFILYKISKSIRIEIMAVFGICLLLSIIIGGTASHILLSQDKNSIQNETINPAANIADKIQQSKISPVENSQINEFRENNIYNSIHSHIDTKLIPLIIGIISFSIIFLLLTNKKMKYIELVLAGLLEISKGNLDYKIARQGEDELALLADNINYMADELNIQIENERKAERIKGELISNVSHDLRTPLTSIKGYIELIKNKKYSEETQLQQYIDIAYAKAEKLEILVTDLFEYTKLINNAVQIEKENILLNELLDQLIEEFVPACEDNNVTMTKDFMKEKLFINVDPNKTVRIFENLLVNAISYSLKPSDIKIILEIQGHFAVVTIKNQCKTIDEEDLKRIFERFYRIEKSRSSDLGGSGLGLAIAKNLMELQGGTLEAKYEDDFISFIARFNI